MSAQVLEPEQIAVSATSLPYLHLPPERLFALRAERLRYLADDHPLGDYLRFVARLCDAQQQVLDQPPANLSLDAHRIEQSIEHGLPPLSTDMLLREDGWLVFLDALLERLRSEVEPGTVADAIRALSDASVDDRRAWALMLLSGQYRSIPAALVPFLGAGLQVAFSYWRVQLPEGAIKDIGSHQHCPCCGSPAMAGVIRHKGKYNGLRYLVCSLCACEWHLVRVKCIHCDSSEGLKYFSFENDKYAADRAPIRAEACPTCTSYLKLVYLDADGNAEALSADLSSLALDMRMDEEGFQRQTPNLMLATGDG
ncbi:formate dehydrogenase accessory protein FdhE [Pseudomonas matsuisoli]|uniref:Protein FdhE homolog n=1 Tax=Pseudomonas matsuisoli TaxID=1515666 RepID=A0A917PU23_9PSED|nr:formate dehydrogenase accessory protein FdhE [Pseudomonas matsuisoli]GGJ92294.1 protein FdhE [Pseudomonas matsuisoli]